MPVFNSQFSVLVKTNKPLSLIHYLGQRFTYKTQSEWDKMITGGLVNINGSRATQESVLQNGDSLEYKVVNYNEPEVPLDYKILGFNNSIMYVHKPAGLPVHRTGKIFFQTLVNLIRQSQGDNHWMPMHRLDAETSGLILFSKESKDLQFFQKPNKEQLWIKCYVAVVPKLQGTKSGLIDTALALDPRNPIRCQMVPAAHPLVGKKCMSVYHEISRDHRYSLLVVSPITGRKHQIRAHLAALGYPIIGDKIYSMEGKYFLKRLREELKLSDIEALGGPFQKLHCFSLSHYKGEERTEHINSFLDLETRLGPNFLQSLKLWYGSENYLAFEQRALRNSQEWHFKADKC